jgi:hypothetical protein
MKFNSRICAGALFLPLLMLTTIGTTPVVAALQQAEAAAAKKPVVVEWVYRIQYGHQDEWWRIFKKYQMAMSRNTLSSLPAFIPAKMRAGTIA